MASLRCEIDEVKHELESAYDLAPEIAQEFLDLLSTAPSPSKGPLIAAFNPKSLSTNKPPLRSKSKAQRRVNAQLATQDTSDETDNNGKKSSTSFWRRPRTRSKSRNPSTNSTGTTTAKPFAPLVSSPETLNKPSLVELGYFPPQQQQTPTPILRQSSYGPPPPAPAINPFATPVIERTEESGGKKKKRPPISGNNSNNKSLPDVPLASTPTTDGGRRRSNSLTKALRISTSFFLLFQSLATIADESHDTQCSLLVNRESFVDLVQKIRRTIRKEEEGSGFREVRSCRLRLLIRLILVSSLVFRS